MYVCTNNKLYQEKGNVLIGVEIHSDKVIEINGTETSLNELGDDYIMLTKHEVVCKWHISEDNPYIFPIEAGVVNDGINTDTTSKAKTTVRKSKRK